MGATLIFGDCDEFEVGEKDGKHILKFRSGRDVISIGMSDCLLEKFLEDLQHDTHNI